MPLILITGISTSGKSAIAQELLKRGYEAYDTERNEISAWYNKKTGKRVAEFGAMPERTESWLNQHEWRFSIDWLKDISKKSTDKLIFICGGGANEAEVRILCQKVIWLKTDEKSIRNRINNQRDHDYGTKPHELSLILEGNKQGESEHRELGATMIDARRPVVDVVDEILDKLAD